jgi:hypothetical protein
MSEASAAEPFSCNLGLSTKARPRRQQPVEMLDVREEGGNSGYKDRKENDWLSFPTAREKGSGANHQSTLFGVSPSPSSAPTVAVGLGIEHVDT